MLYRRPDTFFFMPWVRWPPWASESPMIVSPGFEQRVVDRGVRLRAGVRLDVRVLGAEQRLGTVDRELLGDVDVLAAAVVAGARVALGVLVREHAALAPRAPRGARSSPTRSARACSAGARARARAPRRSAGRPRPAGAHEVVGRKIVAHTPRAYQRALDLRLACTRPARTIAPAPGRLEARPDRRPSRASRAARRGRARGRPPARIAAGTSSSVRGSGPPARLALDCSTGRSSSMPTSITRTPSSSPPASGKRPRRVGHEQRQRAGQQRARAPRACARPARAAPPAPPRARRTRAPRACPAARPLSASSRSTAAASRGSQQSP